MRGTFEKQHRKYIQECWVIFQLILANLMLTCHHSRIPPYLTVLESSEALGSNTALHVKRTWCRVVLYSGCDRPVKDCDVMYRGPLQRVWQLGKRRGLVLCHIAAHSFFYVSKELLKFPFMLSSAGKPTKVLLCASSFYWFPWISMISLLYLHYCYNVTYRLFQTLTTNSPDF